MKTSVLVCVSLLLSGLGVQEIRAAQVTPNYQIFEVKKGDSVQGACTITNDEGEPLNIKVVAKDWFVSEQNKKFSAPDWLVFKEPQFRLENGGSKIVEFTVKAPKKASGELIAMASFHVQTDTATNINRVLSVAIYNTILGTEKLKADLVAFVVDPSSTPFQVGVNIKNTGNLHIRPSGWIDIMDEKKNVLGHVPIEHMRPTYPGMDRTYSGKVYGLVLGPGTYVAQVKLMDIDRQAPILNEERKFKIDEQRKVELVK